MLSVFQHHTWVLSTLGSKKALMVFLCSWNVTSFFVSQVCSSTGTWGKRVCWEFCLTKMWHHLLVKGVLQHYSWVKECIDSFSELLTRYVTPFLGDRERYILATHGWKSALTAFLCSWQEMWDRPMFQHTVTWGLNDRKQRERNSSANIQRTMSWKAKVLTNHHDDNIVEVKNIWWWWKWRWWRWWFCWWLSAWLRVHSNLKAG